MSEDKVMHRGWLTKKKVIALLVVSMWMVASIISHAIVQSYFDGTIGRDSKYAQINLFTYLAITYIVTICLTLFTYGHHVSNRVENWWNSLPDNGDMWIGDKYDK